MSGVSTNSTDSSASATTAADALKVVLHTLSNSLVYTETSNIDTNRKLWNNYAKEWVEESTPAEWVVTMAKQVGKTEQQLKYIGDEWSDDASLDECLSDFLFPLFHSSTPVPLCVAEIGVGGGRVASRISPVVPNLTCFDISDQMLTQAKSALHQYHNIEYHLLSSTDFPVAHHHRYTVVYAFDVFPHCDLHTIYQYLLSLHTLLRLNTDECYVFLSTANLASPLGWKRFTRQHNYTAGGFYFVIPEMIHLLAEKTGWTIVRQSTQQQYQKQSKNIYYQRDYLCVLKPNRGAAAAAAVVAARPPQS